MTDMFGFHDVVEDIMKSGLAVKIKTRGQSMYPEISSGDNIEISPTTPDEVHQGDIIVYRQFDRLVCHRVIRIYNFEGKAKFQTQGDSRLMKDPEFFFDDIVGKVTKIEKLTNSTNRKIASAISCILKKIGCAHPCFFHVLFWAALKIRSLSQDQSTKGIVT